MPQTARSMRNRAAWGIQASEGTPMTTNASLYEVSMLDGGLMPNSDEVPFATSDAQDVAEDFYFRKRWWLCDWTIPVDVDSIGSLFKVHLGTDTPTGAGPYTHVLTKSTPGFMTAYEMKPGVAGGTDYWVRGADGFLRTIEVSASAGEFLTAKLDIIGKTDIFNPTTPPAATRDLRIATTAPGGSLATMIESTLNLDLATTPSTTRIRNIESLSITSSYGSGDLIQTDALTPNYVQLGPYTLTAQLTVILTAVEFQALASTFYGSTTITTDQAMASNPPTPTSGSGLFTFNSIGATASRSVAFAMPAMRWRADFANVNVSGEAVRLDLTGQTKYNANPLTVTAINNRPTY